MLRRGEPNRVDLQAIPLPFPESEELLIHNLGGPLDGSAIQTSAGRSPAPVPTILGYEIVGEGISVGEATPCEDLAGWTCGPCDFGETRSGIRMSLLDDPHDRRPVATRKSVSKMLDMVSVRVASVSPGDRGAGYCFSVARRPPKTPSLAQLTGTAYRSGEYPFPLGATRDGCDHN